MANIDDLSPCDYFAPSDPNLLAVGWLGLGSRYAQGTVSAEFLLKLKALCQSPWEPFSCAGMHQCELCQFDGPSFGGTVFVPHEGRLLVAPVGIVHYIATHWYQPPAAFVEAVLACPPMRSHAYFKALLDNGGRELVKSGKR